MGEHGEHALFLLRGRIRHDGFHHETVHLRLRKVERAFLLDWILCSDDHERFRQCDALAADGGGSFGMASSMADWVLRLNG